MSGARMSPPRVATKMLPRTVVVIDKTCGRLVMAAQAVPVHREGMLFESTPRTELEPTTSTDFIVPGIFTQVDPSWCQTVPFALTPHHAPLFSPIDACAITTL